MNKRWRVPSGPGNNLARVKRMFIAIKVDPSGELLDLISFLKVLLRDDKINWTVIPNFHLTLAFIGDIPDETIIKTGIMLQQVCSDSGQFSFMLSGADLFRSVHDPRIIRVGVRNPDRLNELNKKIVSGLTGIGVKVDTKGFIPHVTFARIKSVRRPDMLKSAIDTYSDMDFQEVSVKEVILFESVLKPPGPIYKPAGFFRV
jgi:2'-5' RNA ligase